MKQLLKMKRKWRKKKEYGNLEMFPHGDVIMDVCINIFG